VKIVNKKKFIIRILELLTIIATIILTILSIKYATKIRGHQAFGGEYLVPVLGLIIILVLESILEESEEKKGNRKNGKRKM
jgi:ABC-type transport system involved in cytochrome bd biosynthesis fused ATPase/permease subunit